MFSLRQSFFSNFNRSRRANSAAQTGALAGVLLLPPCSSALSFVFCSSVSLFFCPPALFLLQQLVFLLALVASASLFVLLFQPLLLFRLILIRATAFLFHGAGICTWEGSANAKAEMLVQREAQAGGTNCWCTAGVGEHAHTWTYACALLVC